MYMPSGVYMAPVGASVGVKWPEKHDYVTRKHDYVTEKTRLSGGSKHGAAGAKNTVERGQKTRCSGGKRHDFVTEKHGPSGARNTNMLPKNTDHAG
jgi:hypothetical protein